jgi:outer membrane protein assembly factor BamB
MIKFQDGFLVHCSIDNVSGLYKLDISGNLSKTDISGNFYQIRTNGEQVVALIDSEQPKQYVVNIFDAKSLKKLWEVITPSQTFALDKENLFCILDQGEKGVLSCLDPVTGKERWRSLPIDQQSKRGIRVIGSLVACKRSRRHNFYNCSSGEYMGTQNNIVYGPATIHNDRLYVLSRKMIICAKLS